MHSPRGWRKLDEMNQSLTILKIRSQPLDLIFPYLFGNCKIVSTLSPPPKLNIWTDVWAQAGQESWLTEQDGARQGYLIPNINFQHMSSPTDYSGTERRADSKHIPAFHSDKNLSE
ncbi:hypothetical protein BTVI_67617 [Pitangus sulphuratus]|nr:hypothetical protein BTVI_67617 [Pitangus sulphuratus]